MLYSIESICWSLSLTNIPLSCLVWWRLGSRTYQQIPTVHWCQRLWENESSRTENQTAEEIQAEQRCGISKLLRSWITVQLVSWFHRRTLSVLCCGRTWTERLTKQFCLMEKDFSRIFRQWLLLWWCQGLYQWKWNRRKKEEEWRHAYACVLLLLPWCLICVVLNCFTFSFTLDIIYVRWYDGEMILG